MEHHFSDRLLTAIHNHDSCLLLGIDPDIHRFPQHLQAQYNPLQALEKFCSTLIEATERYVCGIKIQLAWFEVFGSAGFVIVEKLCAQARARKQIVIIDGKRGDIGSSASAYAKAYLDPLSPVFADALTIHPWLGSEGMQPFIDLAQRNNKGVFVLVKTSNPSADQLQRTTSRTVADLVNQWNANNCANNGYGVAGAVVGATRSVDELSQWRQHMPNAWLLAPGVGAQGGDLQSVLSLQDAQRGGVLVPLSRAVLYASNGTDYAQEAEKAIEGYWQQQL